MNGLRRISVSGLVVILSGLVLCSQTPDKDKTETK